MLFTINSNLLPQLPPVPVKQRYNLPTTDRARAYQQREIARMNQPFVEAEQRQAKSAQTPKPVSFRSVIGWLFSFVRRMLRRLSIALAVPSYQPDYDWPALVYIPLKSKEI